jgi:ATP-dependent protease HslVU (ClpYQ) peptidase subunit
MTILIGAIHNGKAYIGTDSLWTWDEGFVREHTKGKFIDLQVEPAPQNKILIATAGQDKFTQLLEKVLQTYPDLINFTNRRGLIKLVEELHKEAKASGVGDADNNQLPDHDLSFVIATSASSKLWVIESDYGVTSFDDYVCVGSGQVIGEGAMKALSKSGIFGDGAVQIALEVVCELHPYCGGALEIRELDLAPEALDG